MNMKLTKKLLIPILFIITAFTLLFSTFTKPKIASAASLDNKPITILTIDKIDNRVNYYYSSTSSDKITNYVGVYSDDNSEATGVLLDKTNDEMWSLRKSSSNALKKESHYYMYVKLADNLVNAGKNGYAKITATVQLKTKQGYYASTWLNNGNDNAENVYARLLSGTIDGAVPRFDGFNAQTTVKYNDGTAFQDTEYRNVEMTINNVSSSHVMLYAFNEFGGHEGAAVTSATCLYLKQPSFMVTSSDKTAPNVSFSISNDKWSNQNKTLTINATDLEAGVQYISYNGSNLEFSSISDDTKTASSTIDIPNNGTYTFTVTDNVGNSKTYSYVESKIERVAPSFNVNVQSLYRGLNFEIDATFGGFDSPESFYYTLDGSEPTKNSTSLNEINQISLAGYGHYVLKAKGYDEAGNESEVKTYEFDCIYDGEYQISTSAVWNNNDSAGANLSDDANVEGVYEYTLDFEILDGYDFYKILIDGKETEITQSGSKITAYGPMDIKVVLRKKALLYNDTEYVYDAFGVAPDFSANLTELNASDFIVKYSKDGAESGFGDAGVYTITWSIDNDNYIGSGSFDVEIKQKEVFVTSVTEDYSYSEEFNFDYTLSENHPFIFVIFTLGGEEVSPNKPNSYGYEFRCSDANYKIAKSGTLTINKKIVSLSVSGITEFDGEEHLPQISVPNGLEYTFNMTLGGVSKDKLFNAGEYQYTLTVNENELYEGEISGVIVVAKRKVTIKADSVKGVYGDAIKELTYTVENGIEALPKFVLNKQDGITVGTYAITIVEQDLDNFEITYVNASYVIEKRPLYVFALEGQYKYYGESDPALTYTTLNLVSGDILSGEIERVAGESVGTYEIRQGTLNHSQYNIYFTDAVFSILQDQIVIKSKSSSKIFGDADPELETKVLYGELKQGEYIIAQREEGENAGVYSINSVKIYSEDGVDISNNYIIIHIEGEFTVTKKSLKVFADAVSVEYGSSSPLSYTLEQGVEVDGFIGSITREEGDIVGEYLISKGDLSHQNYEIDFVCAMYTITKKTVTVTAIDGEKVYGEQDYFNYTVEGLINGDSLLGELSREEGEDVGEYQIQIGTLCNDNYEIEFIGATYLIKCAPVTVKVNDSEKIFGEDDPLFTYTVNGVKDGDTVSATLVRVEGENAGDYSISASTIDNGNYYLDIENSTSGTLVIKKADVDFEVEETTVTYNGRLCALKPVETSLNVRYEYYDEYGVEKEPIDAGVYQVKVIFDGDENHNAKEKSTQLTINKKRVTIVVDLKPVEYTGSIVSPRYTLSEQISVIIVFEGNKKPIEKGTYVYTITEDESEKNMYIEYNGKLTIN